MALSFPTMAEQAIKQFRESKKTISMNIIAKEMNAFRDDEGVVIVWVFPDDTSVRITGRGKAYCLEAMLP